MLGCFINLVGAMFIVVQEAVLLKIIFHFVEIWVFFMFMSAFGLMLQCKYVYFAYLS